MPEILPIHSNIYTKLFDFYENKKVPHIILHGSYGSGKKTIIRTFIDKVYENDKDKIKKNVMWVNCAHGKGIKFIREDIKFFAKANIQYNNGILFKSIVLFNADFLTTDAQSALRRCIEQFSKNTRFFIIIENKQRLLNPILSRFCEVYVPDYLDETGKPVNLNAKRIQNVIQSQDISSEINSILNDIHSFELNQKILANIANQLYEEGASCLDLVKWIETNSDIDSLTKASSIVCFHKIKSDFRNEKLLILYMLDYIFLRSNKDIKSINPI
jgi:DNA polymerase III delta prime subunit